MNNTTRVAPGAVTLIEHGSKQWAAVTEKVNVFVDELEPAVVGGGAGAAVVAGELDDGLTVTGVTGWLVAGGATAVDDGAGGGGAAVVSVEGMVVFDVEVTTVVAAAVVTAGTLVEPGTLAAATVVGATTGVVATSVVTVSVGGALCAVPFARSVVRIHATDATPAAATAATATNTRPRRPLRGARCGAHVGAISLASSASDRLPSSSGRISSWR